eukprot:TRINITY_DN15494_c0_g1_i1.p1 TRINITY_DN15494_c0_g1~~TRINITY_DN15494_c0_g1_i1.p1  ORF type:complete len:729 (+),score=142.38 TRINITY_DN15494_c0_g1_i1:55-2241(+)
MPLNGVVPGGGIDATHSTDSSSALFAVELDSFVMDLSRQQERSTEHLLQSLSVLIDKQESNVERLLDGKVDKLLEGIMTQLRQHQEDMDVFHGRGNRCSQEPSRRSAPSRRSSLGRAPCASGADSRPLDMCVMPFGAASTTLVLRHSVPGNDAPGLCELDVTDVSANENMSPPPPVRQPWISPGAPEQPAAEIPGTVDVTPVQATVDGADGDSVASSHAESVPASKIQSSGVADAADKTCLDLPNEAERSVSTRFSFSRWEREQQRKSMLHGELDQVHQDHHSIEGQQQSFARRIVTSQFFDNLVAGLLVCNSFLIGLQVEFTLSSRSNELPSYFEAINVTFAVLFGVELFLRITAEGWSQFFNVKSAEAWWNWFDTLFFVFQVAETSIELASRSTSEALTSLSNVGRAVRIARIIRIVRIIRVLRFFRSFRVLIMMIFGTMKSGAWALLVLILIMYVFAVVFAQAVSDVLIDNQLTDVKNSELESYYGSVIRSVLTLFQSIIGGVDWDNAINPLWDVNYFFVFLFLLYIAFVQLVVMNVVTGFFLQSAIEQAQQDQEHLIALRLKAKSTFVTRLRDLFEELDSSHDGNITLQEFQVHVESERMQAILQTLEIDVADAWTLFKLLDADGGGNVDVDEFVEGCIRLKGEAKSIQMAQLMYHHKWIMDKLVDLDEKMSSVYSWMADEEEKSVTPAVSEKIKCPKQNFLQENKITVQAPMASPRPSNGSNC